jgi:hypothetical protein
MESGSLIRLQQALVREWQIELPDDIDREEQLLGALQERIVYFLRFKREGLVAAMYRLDIGERAFEAAMEKGSVDEIAGALAVAVLNREKIRIENRRRYDEGKTE